jgi:catechol 2,3-dioxygenase-like lactoylglutathione lyase family enzyme
MTMNDLQARAVFFVSDAQTALDHYVESLGFHLDWAHKEANKVFVIQVSLFGFQLILNQAEPWTEHRPGHGRVFIGLDLDQVGGLRRHIQDKGIKTQVLHWGAPTLVIRDLDGNELFFWVPESERASLESQLSP